MTRKLSGQAGSPSLRRRGTRRADGAGRCCGTRRRLALPAVRTGMRALFPLAARHALFQAAPPFGGDQFVGLFALLFGQAVADHHQNLRRQFGLLGAHRADAFDQFHDRFRRGAGFG